MVSMKQYLLDTNICVFLLRGQYDIDKKLDKVELEHWLIGCTAVVNDMVMVTENMKHFKKLTGIQLENWIER